MFSLAPRIIVTAAAGIVLCIAATAPCRLIAANDDHWVSTWGVSPAPQLHTDAEILAAGLVFDNQTLREVVHTSIGGNSVRIRLSNAYGKDTLRIAAAHVARSAGAGAIVPGSDHPLAFGGSLTAALPPDGVLLSDPVSVEVPADGNLAVSFYLPTPIAASGIHYGANQTAYIGKGNLTASETLQSATINSYAFLTSVDVLAPASSATLVAFGDSITDGAHTTPDTNRRWPNDLATRLLHRTAGFSIGVVNAGIGGNRLLHDPAQRPQFGVNALARFDHDVLSLPGVRYVILLEGINDIGHPGSSAPISELVTAEEIIGAMNQLIAKAHDHGIKIFGATLLPFADTTIPGYFSPEKEIKRQAVNAWIRTSGAFDGIIDFDKATSDPSHPDHMLPLYDSGDHLHPGDRGYQAMADAIDLSLFD